MAVRFLLTFCLSRSCRPPSLLKAAPLLIEKLDETQISSCFPTSLLAQLTSQQKCSLSLNQSRPFCCIPSPPVPRKRRHFFWKHDYLWEDNYYYFAIPTEDVLEHLKAEDAYANAYLKKYKKMQEEMAKEMEARIPKSEESSPEQWGDWLYWARHPEGQEFPVYCRKWQGRRSTDLPEGGGNRGWVNRAVSWLGTLEQQLSLGEEEVILDMNALAEELGYVHVGQCKPSPDHRYLAYTLDTSSGGEAWTAYVKDLTTHEVLPHGSIPGAVNMEWAADSHTLFYTQANEQQRPVRVLRRDIHVKDPTDELVYEESGGAEWFVDIARTKDWRLLTININSKTSSEVHILEAAKPKQTLRMVAARASGREYFVEHYNDHLLILTNHGTPQGGYQLVRAPLTTPGVEHWEPVLPEVGGRAIEDMDVFGSHCVLYMRQNSLPQIGLLRLPLPTQLPPGGAVPKQVPLPARICHVTPGASCDHRSTRLRFSVSSPVMPERTYDYNLATGHMHCVRESKVPGFQKDPPWPPPSSAAPGGGSKGTTVEAMDYGGAYVVKRMWATAPDRVRVPMTVIHKRGVKTDGTAPALLHGYGAYGLSLEADWSSEQLSLLDRGWVVALAHVRGGGELGRAWHRAGRLENKSRSFMDFIACAELLLNEGLAKPGGLAARGQSAGGLLVGGAVNLRPELFSAIILKVPFLDVLNTMLNPDLPLTEHEYDEWGDPNVPEAFACIRSYSPYDNIQRGAQYPPMLVTVSLKDTRVGYWEGAKWVAKLRESASRSKGPYLLSVASDTGHFGDGGRFQSSKQLAMEYAFLMQSMNRDAT